MTMNLLLVMSVVVASPSSSWAVAATTTTTSSKDSRCEEITIPMCRGIGYNYTFMPNQFNHDTQDEAGLEVHQFWPLVEIQCSADLKFFLCSMYAPICIEDYHQPLPACRTVCERAKAGCAPLMRQYGFAWPERMNCDRLPEYGDSHQLCMDSKNGSEAEKTTSTTPFPKYKSSHHHSDRNNGGGGGGGKHTYRKNSNNNNNNQQHFRLGQPPTQPSVPIVVVPVKPPEKSDAGRRRHHHQQHPVPPLPVGAGNSDENDVTVNECTCTCRSPMMEFPETSPFYNRIVTGGAPNCAAACNGPYFGRPERTFAAYWIGLWSILCCASTAITIVTFLTDMQRFKYPERPIIFLSGCYMMVSIAYIVPLVIGPERVACQGDIVRYESHDAASGPTACTLVFLLLYFFGMASSIWWVILSFTWFLAAGLKWGNEAIASYSVYFHLAAWIIPTVMSISVLATNAVDGDPIAGVCYVGNHNLENLRGFVLIPLFVYLLLGTSFLLAGFVSLFRIRNVIKQQGRNKTDKLEKLMIRIGIFSVLYAVPATIVICCHFYEQHFRVLWQRAYNCPCDPDHRPDYSVFMLKYFMGLGVGISSGVWIWSGKTLDSWRRFYSGLFGGARDYHHPSRDGGGGVRRTLKQASVVQHVSHVHLHKQVPLSHV